MATLTAPATRTCRLTLTIDDTAYTVRPIPLLPESKLARRIRLRKADGTVYFVVQARGDDPLLDAPTCNCPDHVSRRRPCKHLKALKACGLI